MINLPQLQTNKQKNIAPMCSFLWLQMLSVSLGKKSNPFLLERKDSSLAQESSGELQKGVCIMV